jgi:hypothetical protein
MYDQDLDDYCSSELTPHSLLTQSVKKRLKIDLKFQMLKFIIISVAKPNHFYGAPTPGKSFDAAQAPTPASILL